MRVTMSKEIDRLREKIFDLTKENIKLKVENKELKKQLEEKQGQVKLFEEDKI